MCILFLLPVYLHRSTCIYIVLTWLSLRIFMPFYRFKSPTFLLFVFQCVSAYLILYTMYASRSPVLISIHMYTNGICKYVYKCMILFIFGTYIAWRSCNNGAQIYTPAHIFTVFRQHSQLFFSHGCYQPVSLQVTVPVLSACALFCSHN